MLVAPSFVALAVGLFSFVSNAQELDDGIQRWVFNEALGSANATSDSLDVRGYDVTETYPGSEVDGYTLSLTLVGNYPMGGDEYLTGASISYQAPRALQNRSSDRTWGQCERFLLIEDYDLDEDVDRSCEGIVPDECYEALRAMSESGEQCTDGTLEECEDVGVHLSTGAGGQAGAFTRALGLTRHDPDDFEAYDQLLRGVIVAQIGFFEYELDGSTLTPVEGGESIPGVLSCLRVEDVEDGSRTQEDAEAKASNVGMAWGVFAVSLVVSLGLL